MPLYLPSLPQLYFGPLLRVGDQFDLFINRRPLRITALQLQHGFRRADLREKFAIETGYMVIELPPAVAWRQLVDLLSGRPPLRLVWPPPDTRIRIDVRPGNLSDVVDRTVAALKLMAPQIRRGKNGLVRVHQNEDGEFVVTRVTGPWLRYHLSAIIRFERDGEAINQPGLIHYLQAAYREFPPVK